MDGDTIRRRLTLGLQARESWTKAARKAYDYAQWNKQWPPGTDLNKRIHLTFNRIAPWIHFTTGLYADSPLMAEIAGRESTDQWIADLFRAVFEQTLDEDDSHDKILDGIEDCLICGMGYGKELVDVQGASLLPCALHETLDPLSIVLDWNARRVPEDLGWLIELRKVPVDLAHDLWPDAKGIGPDRTYQEEVETPGGQLRERSGTSSTGDYAETPETMSGVREDEPSVTVKEMWYRKDDLAQYGVNSTPEGPSLAPMEGKAREGEPVLRHGMPDVWVAVLIGDKLVQDEPSEYRHTAFRRKTFPYIFYCGHRLRGTPYHVGVPYLLFDQQDMYNRLNSLTIDSAVRNKNLGWIVPKGALDDEAKKNLARFGSEPNMQLEWDPIVSMGAKPERDLPVPLSKTFIDLSSQVAASFDEMSSWRDINRGGMPYETSGRGIMALQRQTAQSHARIERNIKAALLRFGKLRLSNIHQFMSLDLMDRIANELRETAKGDVDLAAEAEALLQDENFARYDIKFSIGVSEQRNRAERVEQMIALHDRGAVDQQALLETMDIPGWRVILQRIEEKNQALMTGQQVLEDETLSALVQAVQGSPQVGQVMTAMLQNPQLLQYVMALMQQGQGQGQGA